MSNPVCNYDLRISAKDLNKDMIINKLRSIAKKWVFQLEKGEETGYLHYQCRVSLIKKMRKHQLLDIFDDNMKPQYCEPTTAKDDIYVMKEQTRVEGPYKDTDPVEEPIPIQFQMGNKELYPYQKDIIEGKYYDFRTVNVVIDPSGNRGKTFTSYHAVCQGKGLYIPPLNDAKAVLEYICSFTKGKPFPKTIIFDLPRAMSKDCLIGMYSAIEQVKNGFIYDTRYSGYSRWVDSPNIWVFTNTNPDLTKLSNDRWRLFNISKLTNKFVKI